MVRYRFLGALLLVCLLLVACGQNKIGSAAEYVVLIGEDAEIVSALTDIGTLVIDAEYFATADIDALRENGVKEIYSYLNVGAIESFRPYYADYVNLALGEYENWPEEKWVNVAEERWQQLMQQRIDELSAKGIDGFFIDNADVYYLYPEDAIYEGLVQILQYISSREKQTIINGGDAFVTRCLEDRADAGLLIEAVNQETVYTTYDFDTKQCGKNAASEREYFTEYLDLVQSKGCKVYTLEYATDTALARKAREYATGRGYVCYVSDNIELRKSK